MNNILTAVSVMALLGAVSCNKEKGVEGAGSTIRFGVSTVYENGPATKTEYSGKDENNKRISKDSQYERIDWVSTDQIRILCAQASVEGSSDKYADYAIAPSGAGTTQIHTATITPVGKGLQWGTGSHDFYALYPSTVQSSASTIAVNGTGATVGGTIPATQTATRSGYIFKPDMDYAYMYAVKAGVSEGADVTMDFHPLVTTLEFTLLTKAGDPITNKLTSVKLSSSQTTSYLTGTFTAELTTSGLTAVTMGDITSGGNEITITLPDGGVQLSTDPAEAYKVTFLTLPLDQTELTLTLGFSDNSQRTLKLKDNGSWITVDACKKTYIWKVDAPLTVDTYTIDPLQAITLTYAGGSSPLSTTFKSYKTSGGTNSPVAFKFQYAASESGPWIDGLPTWITGDAGIDYSGSTSGQTLNITMAAQSNSGEDTHAAALKTAVAKSDFDLSTVNVSTGETVATTTANCYVVQASGSYKFPLVYGNALKDGSANDAAYHRQQSTATSAEYLEYYLDHNDEPINNNNSTDGTDYAKNSIYIAERFSGKGDITAELLWTDAPDLVTNVNISGSGTAAYITFEVPFETICQGNALIAVKVGDKIAWSWHIWVTDAVLSTLYDGSNGYKFPAVNLGWCDGKASTYSERSCYVKAVQTVSGGAETTPIKITQSAGTVTTGGNNPYYQWGRKDPFMASNGTGNTNKTYYGTNKPTDVVRPATLTLGGAIQKPYERYYRTSSPYDWCSSTYYNTWNSTIADYGSGQYSTAVTKTIYDPSPVGFKMPPQAAYSSFTSSFQGSRGSQGYSLKVSDDLLFPASGYRYFDSASLYYVWNNGYYWSAVPYNSGNGYYLGFDSSVFVTYNGSRTNGFAVRPVQELDTNISSGANTAGQDIYNGGSVNGSWGN